MDIDLIGMNGLRASQIIRQYEELHGFHTNIICVTGKDKSQLTDNIFDNYRKYIYIYVIAYS
jgi:CheY-like chemotaxis protein